jgi:hypothetical protein
VVAVAVPGSTRSTGVVDNVDTMVGDRAELPVGVNVPLPWQVELTVMGAAPTLAGTVSNVATTATTEATTAPMARPRNDSVRIPEISSSASVGPGEGSPPP